MGPAPHCDALTRCQKTELPAVKLKLANPLSSSQHYLYLVSQRRDSAVISKLRLELKELGKAQRCLRAILG